MDDGRAILVAGGGIGGLALAQALVGVGLPVRVLEAGTGARREGYRISLRDTGAGALARCLPARAFELAVAVSIRPPRRLVFAGPDLRARLDKPLPVPPAGPAGFGIHRLTLREILLSGLDAVVEHGRRVVGFDASDRETTVTARVADGSTARGRLLVGADGTWSAVRRQLAPDAGLETLGRAVHGRTPIVDGLLDELNPLLVDTFNQVKDGAGTGFSTATCCTPHPLADTAAAIAPQVRLTPVPDYLQWIVSTPGPLPADADAALLHRHARAAVAGWHPDIGRILAAAHVPDTFAVTLHSAREIPTWDRPGVTLLGDAAHTMSPGRGDGANTALRDAALLGRLLAEAGDDDVQAAVGAYEAEMRVYGAAAVRASRTAPFAFDPSR